MRRIAAFAASLSLLAFGVAAPAEAQSRLVIPCPEGFPCFLETIGHIGVSGSAIVPWVATVLVPANVCLSVVSAAQGGRDAEITISAIAPDGRVHRTGFSTEGNFLSLDVPFTLQGWYTVEVDSAPPAVEQVFALGFNLLAQSNCQR